MAAQKQRYVSPVLARAARLADVVEGEPPVVTGVPETKGGCAD